MTALLYRKAVITNRSLLLAACLAAACIEVSAAPPASRPAQPSQVQIERIDGHYRLVRNGQPYIIKGVGGDGSRKQLAAAGGNSVRTWGTDNLQPLLDEAGELGLSVTVGIWLGHERHGFDYTNADQVAAQYASARETIVQFRNHPAVLMWGIGNEMEGYKAGDNAAIWSAINNIASMAKQLDPHHPTMTVVAEIGGERVKNIHRLCPDIDVVGINSYGGVATLPARYRDLGGTKPYVVTEFGPPGVWELPRDQWGMVAEPTSTEKAALYGRAYEQAIAGQRDLCLGGYAFVWGNKQEATATWFGMLLPDGTRLGAVDTLSELWTGQPPANRCPRLNSLALVPQQAKNPAPKRATEKSNLLEPGAVVQARLDATDPENDPLKVRWVLQRDADALGTGGDAESAPPEFPEAIVKAELQQAQVKLPEEGGGYRLFAYVIDNHGGGAVANIPLRVKGDAPVPVARRAELPLVLYDEADRKGLPFVPTGWMGNTKAIKLNLDWRERPHAGSTCMRIDFDAVEGWAGVVWQDPPGDWGDKAGGRDLRGATWLTFWARGERGGETVSFEFGLLDRDKKFPDSAKGKLEKVVLGQEWMRYRIALADKDLQRIKTGFAWIASATGKPLTFFLDDIRYEAGADEKIAP